MGKLLLISPQALIQGRQGLKIPISDSPLLPNLFAGEGMGLRRHRPAFDSRLTPFEAEALAKKDHGRLSKSGS